MSEMFGQGIPRDTTLRLIHRVRTSVHRPDTTHSGYPGNASRPNPEFRRVVIGCDVFQTVELSDRESASSVAPQFTSECHRPCLNWNLNRDAAVVEGLGVDTVSGSFRMPKAANLLSYDTIATWLITN